MVAIPVQMVLDYWIYYEFQRRLEIQIRGMFLPAVLLPSFQIRNVRLQWREKAEVFSGDVRVSYEPLFFLNRKSLRVRVFGQSLGARVLGKWAEEAGREPFIISNFYVDFILGSHGIRQINALDVSSPKFQFHIRESENIRGDPSQHREIQT
ncbi:MAG: hypothetical protein NC930_01720 [Candidatus Omnitrophica bacterium]|nr:hypothetical protein [Candidatus Omnitrophota bacterium]